MARLVAERADALPAIAELFRERGYEGASLSLISERTGLGKGSLYHFFPGGKTEMAAVVLAEIEGWFETNIFLPLRSAHDPQPAIRHMFRAVEDYFQSGRRVCLLGSFALGETRDRFSEAVRTYFVAWRQALAAALVRTGRPTAAAQQLAEETIAGIQGALVLARALDDPASFRRALRRLARRLEAG